MKRFTAYLIPAAAVLAALLSLSCEQQIDYVDATWARPVSPAEGSTLKIDFFKPDDKQVFTWEARPGATYKIAFDVDMHFENACVYDMGHKDSLVLTNSEMLDMLRTVWPDFSATRCAPRGAISAPFRWSRASPTPATARSTEPASSSSTTVR